MGRHPVKLLAVLTAAEAYIRRSSNTLRRSELRGIQLFFLTSVGFSFSIAAAALKNTLILWPRTEVNRSNDGLMSSAFKLNVSPGKQQALLELSPFF